MGLHTANQTSFKKGQKATNWNGFRKGMTPWNKGNSKIMSGENSPRWKGGLPKCISCVKTLSLYKPKSGMCKQCFFKSPEGKSVVKINASKVKKGKESHMWKGGVTTNDRLQRVKFRLKMQKQVLERDNYTCQMCGVVGVDLQVDHIQSWKDYVELRFSLENCRTLCAKCHYQITFGKPMPSEIKGWGHNLLKGGTHL